MIMIETLKNEDGYIYGYITAQLVNDSGIPDEEGNFVYIWDIFVHPEYRQSQTINQLITLIDKRCGSKARYVYWNSEKHNDRQTRSFRRERLAKMGA